MHMQMLLLWDLGMSNSDHQLSITFTLTGSQWSFICINFLIFFLKKLLGLMNKICDV